MMPPSKLVPAILVLAFAATNLFATETENHGLRVLPAPGPVKIDGQFDDWDLSGGVFACGELEHLRDNSAVWVHAMYDSENLYLLARWKDPTPLNNPESFGGHGFNGDCFQFRCILFPDTAEKSITWWDAWRDNQNRLVIGRDSPGAIDAAPDNNRMPNLANVADQGVKMGFHVDADGKGYSQEIAIPWKMLSPTGRPLKSGDRFKFTVEPNFTAGAFGRITIKDIFSDESKTPDRAFTFRAYKDWGWATLEPKGNVSLLPVRAADGRTFPVTMSDGLPKVDWTGLERHFEWPGFKSVTFDMPFKGYVSLNILDKNGLVVRHLLNQAAQEKGPVTVQWDGLTDATFRTPGQPVPAGDYAWKAMAHPGVTLSLRGWAAYSGKAPWQGTPEDFWLGDHGVPSAVVTDGERMYLACDGSEGGRHLIATDFDGHLIWGLQNTSGGRDPEVIAVDHGTIFVVHPKATSMRGDQPPVLMTRVDAKTGAYVSWPARTSHIVSQVDVFGADSGLDHLVGLDARDGVLYGTTGDSLIFPDEITDWKAVLEKFKTDPALATLFDDLTVDDRHHVDHFLAGKEPEKSALHTKTGSTIMKSLNALLISTKLAAGRDEPDEAKRALLNRHWLESFLAPNLKKVNQCVVVLDGNSGAMKKSWPLPLAAAIKVVDAKTAYIICGDEVRSFDLVSGESKPFITGLHNPRSLTIDPQGRILVSLGDPDDQVAVFGADGKELGRVGEAGGRQIGPWQANRMFLPTGLAVDPQGKLWVMEHDRYPKRVSVWELGSTGAPIQTKLVKDFFGSTHYGASGGAINPRDPDLLVGEDCEWRIDPKGGPATCLGTFDRGDFHDFAVFHEGSNGKLYLYTNKLEYGTGAIQVWERLGDGKYALRAEVRTDVKKDPKLGTTDIWTDLNGDGKEEPNELQHRVGALNFTGSNHWSLNLGPDLTLYGFDMQDKKLKALSMEGFTPGGAPKYDIAKLKTMPDAMSDGYERNGNCALPSADNKTILVNLAAKNDPAGHLWSCFDLASGRLLWTYPNPYFQVPGSHSAPQPEPGLFRGSFGTIGTGSLPGVGNFWVINSNFGEWSVLSTDGFFVTRLFDGNVFDWAWPDKPLPGSDLTNLPAGSGGEDFGGSMTQAKDGKVYLEAGKIADWDVAVDGLDKIVPINGGKVQLTEADTKKAMGLREAAMQSTSKASLSIVKATIDFTGSINHDFKGNDILDYHKNDDASVRTSLAYDDKNLYIGWEVKDVTPWINGARDISQMYSCGDTVDLQMGTDPGADPKRAKAAKGDLRLSIGNFKGQPTAVLYRFVSDEKKPRTFSSGVIQGWQVDWVDVLADAEINVKVDPDKGYVVEAAIPLVELGLKPTAKLSLPGDVGVTHGDPAGERTFLRTYWSNQETGLVDDVVFELQPMPRNWGEFTFQN